MTSDVYHSCLVGSIVQYFYVRRSLEIVGGQCARTTFGLIAQTGGPVAIGCPLIRQGIQSYQDQVLSSLVQMYHSDQLSAIEGEAEAWRVEDRERDRERERERCGGGRGVQDGETHVTVSQSDNLARSFTPYLRWP